MALSICSDLLTLALVKWHASKIDKRWSTISYTTNIQAYFFSKTFLQHKANLLAITILQLLRFFSNMIQTMAHEWNPVTIVNGPIVVWPFYNRHTGCWNVQESCYHVHWISCTAVSISTLLVSLCLVQELIDVVLTISSVIRIHIASRVVLPYHEWT